MTVYTAIFGGYDNPLVPLARGERHVLFTDHAVRAPGWDVRVVSRRFSNPARENRYYKLQPHKFFPGETVLYHDGGMRLLAPPEVILERFRGIAGGDHSVFTLRHSLGHSMRNEFDWVRRKRMVSAEVLDVQEARYVIEGSPFDAPVAEARLVVSRPGSEGFFDAWWGEVRQFAHRDQVSFAYARWRSEADVYLVPFLTARGYWEHKPHVVAQLREAL